MNNFKQAILSDQRKLGTWMMTGSDTVAEAMATVGFDFWFLIRNMWRSTRLMLSASIALFAA